jgi:uncharacterized membrane protein SpoIIM required for sporulation
MGFNLRVLVDPKEAEGHPAEMFFVGFAYSILSVILSLIIFKQAIDIVMVTITVVASLPIVYSVIKLEAKEDVYSNSEYKLLKHHKKALKAFLFLFLGFVAGFLLWFVVLSPAKSQELFNMQLNTITQVNSPTGNFNSDSGIVGKIFFNNIKILLFSTLFSLIFGAGAIFILTWNASVMAAAVGSFIKNEIALLATGSKIAYFGIFGAGLLKYMTHGLPEIVFYFTGGLAGGILFNALVRKKCNKHVVLDVGILLGASIVGLLGAALIEVFITPLLF